MKKISEGLRRFVERAPTGASTPDVDDLFDDLDEEVTNVIDGFCKKHRLTLSTRNLSGDLYNVFKKHIS